MKYSLRSLMIVVTLVCVVLGAVAGRIEYLRRWSAYHSTEYRRLISLSDWSFGCRSARQLITGTTHNSLAGRME